MAFDIDRGKMEPGPAKYFVAVMLGPRSPDRSFEAALEAELGPIECRSPEYNFSLFSTYYDEEMGSPVRKHFLVFSELQPMERLVQTKLFTERLQERHAVIEKGVRARRVNLDPGYLTPWSLVLSTVKNHAHRVYMGQGVFAELTLLFRNGAYQPLPWTYADYSAVPALPFLCDVRSAYMRQLKQLHGGQAIAVRPDQAGTT